MGGGLVQLVAIGAQDVFLTGSPQQTFFRQTYRRHTNFAAASIAQTFKGQPKFGGHASCTISRNGDLICGLMVEIVMKKTMGTYYGDIYEPERFLKKVDLVIGRQRIDSMTNTWMNLYNELYRTGYYEKLSYQIACNFGNTDNGNTKRFYVPLPFWFCRGDPTTALPLISLQYHEVELHFEFERAENLSGVDPDFQPEVTLWADYVFLDTDERRWFAKTAHECLIEQTRVHIEPITVSATRTTHNISLPFNHPVKYLVWVFKKSLENHNTFAEYGSETSAPLDEACLQLNGVERFAPRKGSYFNLAQAMQVFKTNFNLGIYAYSFSLFPTESWPSGTLNCSRIDELRLQLITKAATLNSEFQPATESQTIKDAADFKVLEVYARNHNVLRIMSGMAGLAFSN